MIFGPCFQGLWQIELLAEISGNLVPEWRGAGLPLSAEMGCAAAFACLCGHPKIHGDRTISGLLYICMASATKEEM